MVLVAHLGPQQLVQHSDKKAKMCRRAIELATQVVSSVSAPCNAYENWDGLKCISFLYFFLTLDVR